MQSAMVVLSILAVIFWRSLLRFLVAVLIGLLVLGGITVARTLGSIGETASGTSSQSSTLDDGGR